MLRVLHRLDEINCNPDNSLNPTPTGFKSLDKVITGLNRSDLILLAARPGMGKTSFALDIAKHTAVNQKKTVAFFSLEMSRDQIATKLLSSEAMVERTKIFTGEISDEEWIRIIRAGDVLSKYDIYLDDTPGITVGEIRSKLRRLKNIDFVVVDYLQLMSSGDKNNNHVQEISEIIKSLKKLAKEFNIPVLCVSQLSRSPEERDDHRPMISDLGESVSIAQDSDVVLLLYREGYYAKRNDTKIDHKSCECIVAKNSHGETTSVMLEW
jgi:replicative DNA helicase